MKLYIAAKLFCYPIGIFWCL